MRKITSIMVMLMAGSFLSFAQSYQDGINYSFNDYMGTARTVGLGNAFTALGGDLGSIGINPAGSAINKFSQVTITPGLSISGVKATYDPAPGMGGDNQAFQVNTSRTRGKLPNLGFMITWADDATSSSLKGISFGMVGNTTANYNSHITGRGINAESSMLGEIGQYFTSQGYNYNSITANNAYYNGYSWKDVVAARSGMVATNQNGDWLGATETMFPDGSIGTAGLLDQRWGRVTSGYKYDMVINLGLNFSNMFYIGANLGMVALNYDQDTYHRELAMNPDDFLINFTNGATCFDSMKLADWYHAEGEGYYGKLGFIFVPSPQFRVGAAIQTPTVLNIRESWQNYGDINFTDNIHSASEYSPEGDFEYQLLSPARYNVGAALTFENGILSADYEYTDFSTMEFRERDSYDNSAFDGVNQDIKEFTGGAHQIRLGAEIKPTPLFALRAGYNYSTSPYYEYTNNGAVGAKKAVDAVRHAISAGLGFSSSGSFFCDLAVKATFMPEQFVSPYNNYIDNVKSPEISYKHNLFDVVVTFGWRF